ncbi:hypothetical protein K4F52_010078 [Lecanicillium sp. MT-2017a]|nr:hypothetical protein K4F52_010078 [Lecanicillium sp. MT-2017a]
MHYNVLLGAAFASLAAAHGSHGGNYGEEARTDYPNWMTRHMAEEHHMEGWDAGSFFTLHDYDADGVWKPEEIQRTYGLLDPSNKDVTPERRQEAASEVARKLDQNGDGLISRTEFMSFIERGETLPDLGFGPGHHGDDEYEYEIHHWEKYHNEDTKLEDLTHPEDIEHFKHHEQMDREEEKLEEMDKMAIVEENIPAKFRRL